MGIGIAAVCSSIAWAFWLRSDDVPQSTFPDAALIPATDSYATPAITSGIQQPRHVSVSEATLADDAEVLGILIGDRACAYNLSAFHEESAHIVNDVIEELPVTVTYCDRTDYARVLTSNTKSQPVDLWCAGWSGDQMLLLLDQEYFEHDSAKVPLRDYPYERTTWAGWKAKYPDTSIYMGPTTHGNND
jgi:hypothetical protein